MRRTKNFDTVQYTWPKMAAVFLLTDTFVAAVHASGFTPSHDTPTQRRRGKH
jgi:hypothetical protein